MSKLVLFFVCCALAAQAQNLVANGSFEHIKRPPCGVVSVGEEIANYFTDWYAPTVATTDGWFTTELSIPCVLNTNRYAFKPHSGTYCIGLLTSTVFPEQLGQLKNTIEYREYAQIRLIKPLTVGKTYYTEMYVLPLSAAEVFSNNLGIGFTTDSLRRYTGSDGNVFTQRLPITPQVNEQRLLHKANQWVKISGCFKAAEPYRYLTIGNFFSNETTRYAANPSPSQSPINTRLAAYYLVDDVLVRESTVTEIPIAFGRKVDTTLCNTTPITLAPRPSEDAQFVWDNGSMQPSRSVDQAGTYWLTVTQGECSSTDTIRVRRELNPVLPPDTLLCRGEALPLRATHPFNDYVWNTGATDSVITVTESGVYQVRVPSSNCLLSDTIQVTFVDCPGTSRIPNVITPNGDGKNDAFYIENVEVAPWRFEVYNRWGKQVYQSFPYRSEWGGDQLPGGLYYYQLQSDLLKRTLKGWVLLLRQ